MRCYKNQKAFWLVLICLAISVTVTIIVAILDEVLQETKYDEMS